MFDDDYLVVDIALDVAWALASSRSSATGSNSMSGTRRQTMLMPEFREPTQAQGPDAAHGHNVQVALKEDQSIHDGLPFGLRERRAPSPAPPGTGRTTGGHRMVLSSFTVGT